MLKDIKKNLLRGTLLTTGGQVLSVIFLFISTIILTRYFEQEVVGMFFLLMAIWMFLGMIAGLGLDPTLIQYLSSVNDEITKTRVFNNFLFIRVTSLFIISFLFIISTNILEFFGINFNWINYKYYISIIFTLDSLRYFFNAQLQAVKRFKELAIIQVSQSLVKVILYVSCFLLKLINIEYLLIAEVISILSAFIIQQFLSQIKLDFKFSMNRSDLKSLMNFSLPLYMNNFLHIFATRVNSFIIASYSTITDVAFYEISKKIPDGLGRLSTGLVQVYYPYISELFMQKKLKDANNIIDTYIYSISIAYLPIFSLIYFFNKELTIFLFSENYLKSAFPLVIFVFIYFLGLINSLLGYTIVASGKPRRSFEINLYRTIISLLISFALVPFIGFYGAVYSLLIGNIFGFIFSFYALKKISISLNLNKYLLPFLIAIPFFITHYFLYIKNFNWMISSIFFVIILILEYKIIPEFRKQFSFLKNYLIHKI